LQSIPNELLDQFVTGPMSGEAVNAALMALKNALIESSLRAEFGHHLGYNSEADKQETCANQAQRHSRQVRVHTGRSAALPRVVMRCRAQTPDRLTATDTSSVCEVRLAFVQKGIHSFLLVCRSEEAMKEPALEHDAVR